MLASNKNGKVVFWCVCESGELTCVYVCTSYCIYSTMFTDVLLWCYTVQHSLTQPIICSIVYLFLRCIFLCCLFPFTELVFAHTNQLLLLFELIVYTFKIWYSYIYFVICTVQSELSFTETSSFYLFRSKTYCFVSF